MSETRARGSPGRRCAWKLAGLVAVSLAACRLPDDVIAARRAVSDGGDSAGVAGSAGTPTDTCQGFTPALSLASTGGGRQEPCAGWLAARAFSHAVCSCADLNVLAVLASDAWDSGAEDTSLDRRGAAIGVNGNYGGGEYVRVGGSLTVAGTAPLVSRGGIDVAGDLRLGAATTAAGPIFVGRDAWLRDEVASLAIATVGRDLHLGASGSLDALGGVLALGATLQEPFDIAPPCACAPQDAIDIAGIVSDGLERNDNARLALGLGALQGEGSAAQLTLSCGRFALHSVGANANTTLRISGRVLLMVDGDVDLGPRFSLQLDPGAELDWFVVGNLSVSGEALVGDDARPGAVRMYVLGNRDIALPGTARFSANLYAPRAKLQVGPLGDIYGAAFAADVTSLGPLLVHYDRAVLRADEACTTPPVRCNGCGQCPSGEACVGSACGACTTDADCCFPLACQTGTCQALPVE